ncbi:fumarylacetoacetate hydrolase family protein [Paraburkholderia largidicola]|uniref:Fumarylacetoacetase n=1 Tax=Paraburkholderia largidicola TaxID=3014751 RepID=A0A7I8C1V3_9BURK|nr:fumarylacetoacetate hydrolase family protein [Paraburkholderia sp. PGU16]BCF95047.1 fumarylacetoacetase [Paraburkholderia sp. PGU16]
MSANLYVVSAPLLTTLPVVGSKERFPVNRIFCVGRNYAEHAREMGHDPDRAPPFFFMKPATSLVVDGASITYPAMTSDLHHEVELVVALSQGGSNLRTEEALSMVFGYAVGLDMTRRDLQAELKKLGRPWETAKSFDGSAPCSAIRTASTGGHPSSGTIELSVNGQRRQHGDLADMIWNVPETIAYLSTLFALLPGDLIFTGTPSGVGAVARGDQLHASVQDVGELTVIIR